MGKMGLTIMRISLIVFCSVAGIYIGQKLLKVSYPSLWGGIGGGLLALGVILLEIIIKRASGKGIVGGIVGLIMGFFFPPAGIRPFSLPSSMLFWGIWGS
jgi:hypothetical protein